MSNHKSNSSLKSYNRSMSSNQKKTMSTTLSTMVTVRKHVESTSPISTMDILALRSVSETGVSTVTNLISSTTSVHKRSKSSSGILSSSIDLQGLHVSLQLRNDRHVTASLPLPNFNTPCCLLVLFMYPFYWFNITFHTCFTRG